MINAIGRRKTAVARVYLMKGEGKITVNGKDYREYFPQIHVQHNVTDPFGVVGTENIYDLKINEEGNLAWSPFHPTAKPLKLQSDAAA